MVDLSVTLVFILLIILVVLYLFSKNFEGKKENSNRKNMNINSNPWIIGAFILYTLSFVSACVSLFKLWVYRSEDFSSKVNYYVGGDAYNYIINGTHATVYMLLSILFTLIASVILIIFYLKRALKLKDTEY